jgi:hypothetical protein
MVGGNEGPAHPPAINLEATKGHPMTATEETTQPLTFSVDPARLNSGTWCHAANKTIAEGDIAASYSADRIGMERPIGRPFSWQGALWVCVSLQSHHGAPSAEAYRLMDARAFAGEAVSYAHRVANGDDARCDLNGFYHGMTVTYAGTKSVLCGPPARFEAGQAEQLDLFG